MGTEFARVRFGYSKRRGACFIPHQELPTLFGRGMRRAGLTLELTQGFSPHPRITLAPPLPVGVIGLFELGEVWVKRGTLEGFKRLNRALPEGFALEAVEEVEESAPSLSKLCNAGEYLLKLKDGGVPPEGLAEVLGGWDHWPSVGIDPSPAGSDGHLKFIMLNPDQVGPSMMVKFLISSGLASSWSDIELVRVRLGRFDRAEGFVDLLPRPAEGVSV
ncbi:MAG: TIGR03936 family radical SAM-associated protein [Thermanaerothrix sp.]|nr:TIGR03936 family radical SAM-associated protein [Thermanaerothrix sp.]